MLDGLASLHHKSPARHGRTGERWLRTNESEFPERAVIWMPDNYVIHNLNLEQLAGTNQIARDPKV